MHPVLPGAASEAEIQAIRLASNQAIREHDIHAFAASLADDFLLVRSNGDFIPTRQAYIDGFTAAFADPNAVLLERIPDKIEPSAAAPLAAEHGRWTATLPDGRPAYGGVYMAMWRSTPSGWKIRSELFVVLHCDDAHACALYCKP